MPYTTTISGVQTFIESVLGESGVPSDHAQLISEICMDSELRGYPDHGIGYFSIAVARWYREGGLNADPDIRVIQDGPAVTLLDGDGGLGAIGSAQAMDISIEKASKIGIAVAGVANSINFIAGAPYVMKAAEAGFIAFICSNVPGISPPTGGRSRTFGTNPLAYAVPAGNHQPMLLDISTSATAGGKIYLAGAKGEKTMDSGLAIQPDGRAITDPREFDLTTSLVLPMAGPKGYGMMMMVDVLSGVLTGSQFATDLVYGPGGALSPDLDTTRGGQFMWVIDPSQFMPREEFLARMDTQIEQIKSGTRIDGVDEIFIPGERGLRRKAELLAGGTVDIVDLVWSSLESLSEEQGIPLPELV